MRAVLEYGAKVTGASYARANQRRAEFTGRLGRMLGGIDCLVCPTMANAPRQSTLTVPCGFSAEGLPLSVQFVGRRLSEAVACRVGYAFEQATE